MPRYAPYWAIALLFSAQVASAQNIRQDLQIINGQVEATAVSGNLLYIGGAFTYIGPITGEAVPFDAVTANPVPPFPQVSGPRSSSLMVTAVVPDGSGGYFIGGNFTSVGGLPRRGLAHILADRSVAAWDPQGNGYIRTMVLVGSTLYVGGGFQTMGGQPRQFAAALDVNTGLSTGWIADTNSDVWSIAVSGSSVFLAGQFTQVNATSRPYIASVDATTGALNAWDAHADNWVTSVATSGTNLFLSGNFTTVGFKLRSGVAVMDVSSAAVGNWNPTKDGPVSTMAVNGSTLYLAGSFGLWDGQVRSRIAAVDVTTQVLAPGFFPPNIAGGVTTISFGGSSLYIGGNFPAVNGLQRDGVAALDLSTGALSSWAPSIGRSSPGTGAIIVTAVRASGSEVYVGGDFDMAGGKTRHSIAAIDLTTGAPTSWNPDAQFGDVLAIAPSGSRVYVGGGFSFIGGAQHYYIAALDATTGTAMAWDPSASPNNSVLGLAVNGSTLYACGKFQVLGGQSRAYVGAVDVNTGLATSWNANVVAGSCSPYGCGVMNSLVLAPPLIYIGGVFIQAGGQSRGNIAAIDLTTGNATSWDPTSGGPVQSMLLDGSNLYVGGSFSFIGGQPVQRLASVSTTTGNALPWTQFPNSSVNSLVLVGSELYFGGSFTSVGGTPRFSLAAVDAATGALRPWNPNPGPTTTGQVNTLAFSAPYLYAGGTFTTMKNLPIQFLAGISEGDLVGVPEPPLSTELTLESRPNPFRATTSFHFTLPRAANVSLALYDLSGREIANLAHGARFVAGPHDLRWDASRLPSGVYLCRLRVGDEATEQRVVHVH